MPFSSNMSPSPQHCPLCGVAMIGRRSHPESKRLDVFQCLRCETVIDLSGNGARNPQRSDE
jgi:transposase